MTEEAHSYFISYTFEAPRGVQGWGDATCVLKAALTPVDIPTLKIWLLRQVREKGLVHERATEDAITLVTITRLANDPGAPVTAV